MNKRTGSILRRTVAILIAAAVTLTGWGVSSSSFGATKVYADPENGTRGGDLRTDAPITTWAELREAIENAADGATITLSQDVVAEGESITIPDGKKITIKANSSATIWRKNGDADFSMFVVGQGSNLVLGEGLTLSGKTGSCAPSGEGDFTVTWSNGVSGNSGKTKVQSLTTADFDKNLYNTPGEGWSPENGFTFNGWKWVDASGNEGSTEGASAFETTLQIPKATNGDATIVARWARTNYKVTWSNGVADNEKTQTWALYPATGETQKSAGDNLSFTAPDDWKPGDDYVFAGWTYRLEGDTEDRTTSGDNKANIVDGSGAQVKFTTGKSVEMKIVARWEKPAAVTSGYLVSKESPSRKLTADYTSSKVQLHAIDGDSGYTEVLTVSIDSQGHLNVYSTRFSNKTVYSANGNPMLTDSGTEQFNYIVAHSNTEGETATIATSSSDPIYLYDTYYKQYLSGYGTSWSRGTPLGFKIEGSGGGGTEPYSTTVTPSYATPDPEEYTATVDPEYNATPPSQTCEGDEGCASYTADDSKVSEEQQISKFSGGTMGNDKGFFVQVDKGTLSIEGAKLTGFITDGTVTYAAPIVVNGGTFSMKGGEIAHNSVGYTADNSWLNRPANQIGKDAENGKYEDQGQLKNWAKTETAGAVILTNGASGTMSSGTITDNRGDTGAIVVQGGPDNKGDTIPYTGTPSTFVLTGGTISNNAGVHHAGAVYIYNGAGMDMKGGTISGNFAWNKGGAIWVSEEVYGSSKWDAPQGYCVPVADASFVMYDGTISDNMAIQRAGAIEVMSNHVALIKGNITGNLCRVLGGAIYVEGDGPKRNYRLYIQKGDIAENSAVNPNNTTDLQRRLTTTSDCDKVNNFDNNAGGNVADKGPFNGHYGFGGGLWLCPFGGNAAIDIPENENQVELYNVFVGNNTASNQGKDIRIQPFRGGKVNGVNLIAMGPYNEFAKQGDGSVLEDNRHYSGPLNLENNKTTPVGSGVIITGNKAAAGGGIASNGTVMLGLPEDVITPNAKLKIAKKWSGQIDQADREPVTVKIYPTDEDGNRVGDKPISEVKLNGTADQPQGDITADGQAQSDTYGPNDSAFEIDPWVAEFGVPLTATINGEQIPLLLLEADGTTYDPSNIKHIKNLYEGVKNREITKDNIKVARWLVEVVEEKDGEEIPYKLPSGDVTLNKIENNNETTEKISDTAGNTLATFMTANLDMELTNTIGNDIEHEIEKYVGEAVHENITVDEVFRYDILAYVTMDADIVAIEDQLIEALEFAPGDVTILDIGERVNHEVNYDVAGKATGKNGSVGIQEGDPIYVEGDPTAVATVVKGDGVEVAVEGKVLEVTLDNGVMQDMETGEIIRQYDTVTKLRGHWVKVSFYAQITEEIQNKIKSGEMTIRDLEKNYEGIKAADKYKAKESIYPEGEERPEPNVGNAPVKSDEDHEGLDNTACYKIIAMNGAHYEDESNTVTVKPEEPTVEKYVNQAVHKDIAPDEIFTYDIIGYITKDADKVVFEDELVKDLEFACTSDEVKVTYLDSNNHKPFNDIEGNSIEGNDDASVASEGWQDVPKDGLSVKMEEGKLTVTIDDDVKVDQTSGKVTGRTYTTVQDLRTKYVKVTFQAQLEESIREMIRTGQMSVKDLSNTEVAGDENDPVLSEEAHDGVENSATLKINVGNEGKYDLESNIVTVKPEEPEIEKYVNKKEATEEERDGTVHTDLSAFDEVYTYDIQAYVTKDAKYVVVSDQLVEVLDFANTEIKVAYKAGDGADGKTAPALSKPGTAIEEYSADFGTGTPGKLVVTFGSDTSDAPVLPYAGQWLQITFDAKIKEEYKTVEALKEMGVEVWTTITENDPVDDADTTVEFSGATADSHEGVVNTASYTINKIAGAEPGHEWQYSDKSNTVTVQPPTVKREVKVTKVWEDDEDLYGQRPDSVKVKLLADGEVVEEYTLTEKVGWTYTFTDLPAQRKDGEPIVYTVEETEAPDGYVAVYEGDADKGLTVKNEFEVEEFEGEKTEIPVKKVWDDADNKDKKRPTSIVVRLLVGGRDTGKELTLTADKKWTGTFTGLPKYDTDGEELVYTITEDEVPLYTTSIDGFTVTNTYTPEPDKPVEPDKPKKDDDTKPSDDKPDKKDNTKPDNKKPLTPSKKKAAKTGDDFNAGLWFALLGVAAAGAVLTLRKRRRGAK